MRRDAMKPLLVLLVFVVLGLTGCGSGGGEATPVLATTQPTADSIKKVGWYIENSDPDLFNDDAKTCSLVLMVYYDETIAAEKIDRLIVNSPIEWHWTVPASPEQFGTSGSGKPFIGARLSLGANPQTHPLGGSWSAQLTLKDGTVSYFAFALHEPGSKADATHQYLYTKEDWMPSADQSQYVAALGRLPSLGYTTQYSAADGGRITTTGLFAVRTSFLAAEPAAYNMFCWLYDADKAYLGHSTSEYSAADHSKTDLIAADGELSITTASTVFTTGTVDLSKVKYIRFVYIDGAQYAPSSYSTFDYRSISSLITVN